MNLLRFNYAKKHGIVLIPDPTNKNHVLLYHQEPSISVLNEIRRFVGERLTLKAVSQEEFNQQLVKTYETNTSAAMQMAEDLGESLSLSDLMQDLPQSEDLLEGQDDAPIIRLLNA